MVFILGRPSRRVLAAIALTLLLWSSAAAQTPVTALALKAAFLFNFAKFAEWPPDAASSGPLMICVVSDTSMAEAVEHTIHGQAINGRKVVVSLVTAGALGICHVVYITGVDPIRAGQLVDALRNAPVLTVGDGDQFAQGGGIIGLFAQDGKMHFAVNLDAAQRARLHLSSRLLSLATLVKDSHATP